ncbi:MAG: hypothetical protein V2A70_09770 [Candidatus Omnitrophota bacterium]
MRRVILTVFIVLFLTPASFASQDVKYAGFAFVGDSADIPVKFKYTDQINQEKDTNGMSVFDRQFLEFFKGNATAMPGINLSFLKESEIKLVMALALTRENVSVVNIDDVYKVVVSLSCNLVFLNFDGMTVAATYPIYLEYVDARTELPDEAYKKQLVAKLYFDDAFSIKQLLKDRLKNIGLKNDGVLNMKILNVVLEDAAKEKLTLYKDDFAAFESVAAQRLSDVLSSKLNISILPYAKDFLTGKMSLRFSNAEVQNFQIPDASYGIDFTLRKLTKDLYKEGVGDNAFLYGAYTTVKVYDPELARTYWEEKVKFGAVKSIPKLQKTFDDFSVFDEMTGLVMGEIVKKIKEDKKFYKEVIAQCLNR